MLVKEGVGGRVLQRRPLISDAAVSGAAIRTCHSLAATLRVTFPHRGRRDSHVGSFATATRELLLKAHLVS